MKDLCDLGRGGLSIQQYKDGFRSGEDSVALAHFALRAWAYRRGLPAPASPAAAAMPPPAAPRSLVDIGCGAGLILILLLDSCPRALGIGLELVARQAALAEANLARNGLSSRAWICNTDVRALEGRAWPWGKIDLLVCNPPYRAGSGPVRGPRRDARDSAAARGEGEDPAQLLALERRAARFDDWLNARDLARLARMLMDEDSLFCLVYPLARRAELCRRFLRCGLAPCIYSRLLGQRGKEPKQALLAFTRREEDAAGAAAERWPDLVLREADGGWTEEGAAIFSRARGAGADAREGGKG